MDKIWKVFDEIYNRCTLLKLDLSKQEKDEYLEEATKKNKYAFDVLVLFVFAFELYNMFRVLFISKVGLGTLNNRIYFTMYITLFVSGIIYLILEYCMRNSIKKLNYLYMFITFSWYLWHIGINYYDLTKNSSNGIAIYMVAVFASAIFFQCKPLYGILLHTINYVIFIALTHDLIDGGVRLNLLIIVMMSVVILTRRYLYMVQSIKKKNELRSMSDEIQKKRLELQVSLRNQKVIMEYTNDIIIEWNSKKDILNFSNNVKNKFMFPIVIENAKEWIYKTNDIHQDDVVSIVKEIKTVIELQQDRSIKLRIREKTGDYAWYEAKIFIQHKDVALGTSIIGIITNIDKQQRQMEELLVQSSRDSLTGLYNKMVTEQKIDEQLRNGTTGAMYMLDIDNFKAVNDTLGHAKGDEVIVEVARELQGIFDEKDIIGRVGGDEFIVFCSGLTNEELIKNKAQMILQCLDRTYTDEKKSIKISASIGVCLGIKEDQEFKKTYQKVDAALYRAKEQGKNQFCFEK